MVRELLIFDMDGVLVDVRESYRETIRQTVEHFTGRPVSHDDIQRYKNAGGWNNDWKLSHRMVADLGVNVDYASVVDYFQKLFLGQHGEGLIQRERWIAKNGLLDRLAASKDLAIYTGRPNFEARLTLNRFAPHLHFDPVLTADDVTRGKPDPEGLQKIAALRPGQPLWYIGDTVDDARCAKAAGVRFLGIASRSHSRRQELLQLFVAEDAIAVFEDINALEDFFAQR
ncbi:MAG: HAD-IA family hydrolase [Bryobacteraceae bacterium]|nr:HAD-IA family hydrolase [Bryobacteraceae bacterium]MDW8377936.1 HAD-IA family hydrolase [Bryobacterales bacterium]